MNSRRTFMFGAGGAFVSHLGANKAMSANDKVRIAVLGVNGRGKDHIQGLMRQPDAEIVCLCDPDMEVLIKRQGEFEKAYGKKPAIVQDLRKVFDNKEIDAVTVATPNHWHALAANWAARPARTSMSRSQAPTISMRAANSSKPPRNTTASSSTASNCAPPKPSAKPSNCSVKA